MIVCPTPPQMNDFCDLLGTPDAPVSKIASVNRKLSILSIGGARLIFMNSSKRPTKSLIKKWDVVMSSWFVYLLILPYAVRATSILM